MKTYQIQFMSPNGSDNFVIIKSSDLMQAEIEFQKNYPEYIVLDIMELN